MRRRRSLFGETKKDPRFVRVDSPVWWRHDDKKKKTKIKSIVSKINNGPPSTKKKGLARAQIARRDRRLKRTHAHTFLRPLRNAGAETCKCCTIAKHRQTVVLVDQGRSQLRRHRWIIIRRPPALATQRVVGDCYDGRASRRDRPHAKRDRIRSPAPGPHARSVAGGSFGGAPRTNEPCEKVSGTRTAAGVVRSGLHPRVHTHLPYSSGVLCIAIVNDSCVFVRIHTLTHTHTHHPVLCVYYVSTHIRTRVYCGFSHLPLFFRQSSACKHNKCTRTVNINLQLLHLLLSRNKNTRL